MAFSQYPFQAADPPSVSGPADASWPPPEAAWTNSVVGPHPLAQPNEADDAYDDTSAAKPWPWWAPTRREAVTGFLVGATLGALVMVAVALDLEDYTPPAASAARTARSFERAPARKIEIATPPSAPARAPHVASAEEIARRNSRPHRPAAPPHRAGIVSADPFSTPF